MLSLYALNGFDHLLFLGNESCVVRENVEDALWLTPYEILSDIFLYDLLSWNLHRYGNLLEFMHRFLRKFRYELLCCFNLLGETKLRVQLQGVLTAAYLHKVGT